MTARLHRTTVSVISSNQLRDLTAAIRLHLLSNQPSNAQTDAVVTILEAFIASRLAAKAGQDYLWTRGDAKMVLEAF